MLIQQLHITVEIDPALVEGMHDELQAKLARGLRISTCYRGVRVDGLPGMTRHAVPIFASSSDAVMHLHTLADTQAEFAERLGTNATAHYMRDRATFLRLAAGELIRRRRQLWPAEADKLAASEPSPQTASDADDTDRRYWTAAEIKLLRSLLSAGKSRAEIAKQLGRSQLAINTKAYRLSAYKYDGGEVAA